MLEREYKDLIEQIAPCPALRERTVGRMLEEDWKRAPSKPRKARHAAVVAAVCVLVVALSVTAAAAAFPGFREMLFGKGSPVAEVLQPVSVTAEENGIEMEVLGAMGDKGNVIAYFTLRDAEGLNRLSQEMSVNAYAKLNGEYPPDELVTGAGRNTVTSVLDYNEESQTAFCKFEMITGAMDYADSTAEPYDATGASVRLRIMRIWHKARDEYVPVDISAVELTTETLPVTHTHDWKLVDDEYGGHLEDQGLLTVEEAQAALAAGTGPNELAPYYSFTECRDENGAPVVLKPGKGIPLDDDDGYGITAVGFIGGKLHVQYKMQPWTNGVDGILKGTSLSCVPAGEGRQLAEQLSANGVWGADPDLIEKLNRHLVWINYFEVDESGQVIWDMNSEHVTGNDCYKEAVFSIGPEELADNELLAELYENVALRTNLCTEDFVLDSALAQNAASYSGLTADGISIDGLDITALGVYVNGPSGEMKKVKTLELLCGGESFPYSMNYSWWYDGEAKQTVTIKFIAQGPAVEPKKVTAVRINGEEIPLT